MGIDDKGEQLRAAQAYAVELEARLAELESELSSMEIMCTDHEADHRRWSDEAEADRDRWKARAEAAEARLSGVDVYDVELLRRERDAFAAVIDRVRAEARARWGEHGPLDASVVVDITADAYGLDGSGVPAVLRARDAEKWHEGLHAAYAHVDRLEDAEAAGQGVLIPDPVNPYREETNR